MTSARTTSMIPLSLGALAFALLAPSLAHADEPVDPPSVEITSPADGAMFDGAPALIDVELDVFEGFEGLEQVELRVDDVAVQTDTEAPYAFTGVELAEGMHTLIAVGDGNDGGEYSSAPVAVAVLGDGGTGEPTGGTAGTTTGPATGEGDDQASSACKCAETDESGGFAGLLGLGLVGLAIMGASPGRRREERA